MKEQVSKYLVIPDDRYYIWDGYRELIEDFLSKVENMKEKKFTKYDFRQEITTRDKDFPSIEKLFNMLIKVEDFVKEHTDELFQEFNEWDRKDWEAYII